MEYYPQFQIYGNWIDFIQKNNYQTIAFKKDIGEANYKKYLSTKKILCQHIHRIEKHQYQQINQYREQRRCCQSENDAIVEIFSHFIRIKILVQRRKKRSILVNP